MADFQHDKLPPGWDCKYDVDSGKCYYFNYLTKAMSLEDPRIRLRQLQQGERTSTESIPMQPVHGSPYHVYPTNNYPAVQAFQGPSNSSIIYNVASSTASPTLNSRLHQQLEMSPILRKESPHAPRIMSQLVKQNFQQLQHQQAETSFTTAADTDAAVYKINTMFPTASESHIRLLLKKYHNREAVVISALQVEKHPLTTPGPYSTPPPPGRHTTTILAAANAFGMSSKLSASSMIMMTPPLGTCGGRFGDNNTSRTGSPIPPRPGSSCASGSYGSPRVGEGYRSSPKPHSSPKMKLRYLKSIFPKAEETLLLDILTNADNNVQIASEKLISMGYEKRDTTVLKVTNRNREEQVMRDRKIAENTPPTQPKIRTNDEKLKIKSQLQNQYKDVPGRIITMALESVDYCQDRACQILKIVMQDDKQSGKLNQDESVKQSKVSITSVFTTPSTAVLPTQHQQQQRQQQQQQDLSCSTIALPSASAASTLIIHDRDDIDGGDVYENNIDLSISSPPSSSNNSGAIISPNISVHGSPSSSKSSSSPSPHPSNLLLLLSNKSLVYHDNQHNSHHRHEIDKTINHFDDNGTTATSARKSSRNRSKTNYDLGNSNKSSVSPPLTTVVPATSAVYLTSNEKEKHSLTKNGVAVHCDSLKPTCTTMINKSSTKPTNSTKTNFKSVINRHKSFGPNTELCKGPNEDLLLIDYIAWNGANPELSSGHKALANGSNTLSRPSTRMGSASASSTSSSSSSSSPGVLANGPNPDLCKGSKTGLAKGSIYSQQLNRNVKCN